MFKHKKWAKKRKSKDQSPENCPSLASDSSGLSHNLGDIDLRASSLDINGLLSAVNTSMAYDSDEESIQASPTLEDGDTFGPLQFQEGRRPNSFVRQGDAADARGEPRGPVTGSSSMLAPKLAPVQEQASTINFTKQKPQSSGRYPSMGQTQDKSRRHSGQSQVQQDQQRQLEDNDDLPFAATRQMASAGVARTYLPEISTGIVMTNDKFETYRKSLNSLEMLNRQNSIISTAATSDDEDEEADIELTQQERRRKQQVALARQQQEAHLSVHRQKMNKMVGGEAIVSTTFDEVEQNDDDIMEDVPLSILRAHGFPKAHKKTEPSSPNMAGFDSTTPAGANAAGATANPGLSGSSSGLVNNTNRRTLPPVFADGNTFAGGRGLVGEIAREEEAKRNRVGRSGNSMIFEGGLPHVDSRQSMMMAPAPANPMLNDLKMQMQQMSEMQLQLMHMASGNMTPDSASRMGGYSRAPSIRSFGGMPQPYSPPPFSPGFGGSMTPRQSVNELNYRARPVRQAAQDEDEDEDEAWRKFAEKRQSIKSQWIANEG